MEQDYSKFNMLKSSKRVDKVGTLIKVQSELISEMYQERLDKKGLVDPEPLRRMIVGGHSLIEVMFQDKRVSGDTLEGAIGNLLKRDKERGDIIEGLESLHLRKLELRDAEIERLKDEIIQLKKDNENNDDSFAGLMRESSNIIHAERAKTSKVNKEKLKLMSLIQKERKAGDCVSDTIFTTYKTWQKKQKAVKL